MPDLITTLDQFEAEYKKTIGETLAHRASKEASLDNIRRYGDGAGDYNPLYRDPQYAQSSRFGMVTAPPTFLYAVSLGVIAGETGAIDRSRVSTEFLPVNYAGAEIDFIRPIWLGDTITCAERVGETLRKTSRRIGKINFNTAYVTFTNQRKELVATIKTTMARFENTGSTLQYDREAKSDAGAGRVLSVPADPLVWERARRGSTRRNWPDVVIGEEIPALPKGTYSVSELFLFTHAVLGTGRSKRAYLEAEGSADLGGGGRFDEEHAQKRRNMPGQFDFGPQRVCWLSQIVTDWMGDEGTLKKLTVSVRHPNIVGDTNTVYGKVTNKFIEDDEHRVELQIENRNQAGLATALGTAIVALPA